MMLKDILMNVGVLIFLLGIAGVAREICHILYEYGHETKSRKALHVADTAAGIAAYCCLSNLGLVFSYLCVSLDAPLIDPYLIRLDAMLGFDWERLYRWVHSHQDAQTVLALAYDSLLWQSAVIPLFLGLFGYREYLAKYLFCMMLATFLAIFVSTPFPAEGAFVHFNINDPGTASNTSYFGLLRSGAMRLFDLGQVQGLIAMPSLHTAYAIIFIYALRHIAFLFPFSALLNLVMVASTPTQGGHYLVDVIAGVLLAAIVIGVAERLKLFEPLRHVKLGRDDGEAPRPLVAAGSASCAEP